MSSYPDYLLYPACSSSRKANKVETPRVGRLNFLLNCAKSGQIGDARAFIALFKVSVIDGEGRSAGRSTMSDTKLFQINGPEVRELAGQSVAVE
jgi:hypothetical protein